MFSLSKGRTPISASKKIVCTLGFGLTPLSPACCAMVIILSPIFSKEPTTNCIFTFEKSIFSITTEPNKGLSGEFLISSGKPCNSSTMNGSVAPELRLLRFHLCRSLPTRHVFRLVQNLSFINVNL
ncbi:hypothetical protein XU18_2546 [Perkinsela sp. CCAP 1560/4]|nr:hypothetical protein XU18_2546 [Perkinsela sp. CCAP 1560/4]|eukprot:KNH06645.1 hypothetical protein XU18_2546 [Perkinsela sp. CCAP 1560/4]